MTRKYLVDDDATQATEPSTDDDSSAASKKLLDNLFDNAQREAIDLDELMLIESYARMPKGVDVKHLAKTWRIDLDLAKRLLDITSHNSAQTYNPTLSRNYGTNNHMLQYKHTKDNFFMETFFSTKKSGKSTQGHKYCQLFVTDKGFVYVVLMKSKRGGTECSHTHFF